MSTDHSITSLLPLHFDGYRIRAHVDEMGMIWWVAQDVCVGLGLKNVAQATSRLDDDEKNTIIFHDGIRGNPTLLVVNECSAGIVRQV